MLDWLKPWMFAKESCTEEWSTRGLCGVGSKAGREEPAKPSDAGYGATVFVNKSRKHRSLSGPLVLDIDLLYSVLFAIFIVPWKLQLY